MEIIDGYPDYMMESIRLVEEKREENIERAIEPMSMDEREDILKRFHPDYMEGTRREVRIGVDKGKLMYNGIVDLLEARPALDPRDVDLDHVDFDVDILIVGGGGAGTVAALFAHESGVPVDRMLIATKLRHGDANSMMAQGGIQAADRPVDSPLIHYLDIYGGGHFTNKPEMARALAM
ncbi:MAG TPA: FAD-binding protein, partial [Thermoplasmata archaeon]|nr:FAD-binding protein [Thermoplasmata archaeon]